MSQDQREALGQRYLDGASTYRTDKPFFIDKMPNNWVHIGLIKTILPNATIIDARRHPMAACFANFKQLFARGQEFTYGLEEIGHYYADYLHLMDHWHSVLPQGLMTVQYETVVEDLETQVRALLDHCQSPLRGAVSALLREGPCGANGKFRAGPSAHLPRCPVGVAAIRGAPRPVESGA